MLILAIVLLCWYYLLLFVLLCVVYYYFAILLLLLCIVVCYCVCIVWYCVCYWYYINCCYLLLFIYLSMLCINVLFIVYLLPYIIDINFVLLFVLCIIIYNVGGGIDLVGDDSVWWFGVGAVVTPCRFPSVVVTMCYVDDDGALRCWSLLLIPTRWFVPLFILLLFDVTAPHVTVRYVVTRYLLNVVCYACYVLFTCLLLLLRCCVVLFLFRCCCLRVGWFYTRYVVLRYALLFALLLRLRCYARLVPRYHVAILRCCARCCLLRCYVLIYFVPIVWFYCLLRDCVWCCVAFDGVCSTPHAPLLLIRSHAPLRYVDFAVLPRCYALEYDRVARYTCCCCYGWCCVVPVVVRYVLHTVTCYAHLRCYVVAVATVVVWCWFCCVTLTLFTLRCWCWVRSLRCYRCYGAVLLRPTFAYILMLLGTHICCVVDVVVTCWLYGICYTFAMVLHCWCYIYLLTLLFDVDVVDVRSLYLLFWCFCCVATLILLLMLLPICLR